MRFTVESDRPSYWRTGIYDRFTGDEWVRTGTERPLEDGDELAGPPGPTHQHRQVVTAETELGVMPAAPSRCRSRRRRRAHGGVETRPRPPDDDADRRRHVRRRECGRHPQPDELREAGTDYPDEIRDHYLQRPEETSSEFEDRTAEITADAETPYEKAVAIERHLRSSKEYSLDVERPQGNVAEEFLLEMDEGYCVYFATAMTQMLRAEDVPTRYVTGYTSGEQVDDDEYVVRGLDAHAWVEVYFPETGGSRSNRHRAANGIRFTRNTSRRHRTKTTSPTRRTTNPTRNQMPTRRTTNPTTRPTRKGRCGGRLGPRRGRRTANDRLEADPRDDPSPPGGPQGPIDTSTDDGDDDRELSPPVVITRELLTITAVLFVGLVAGVHRAGQSRAPAARSGCSGTDAAVTPRATPSEHIADSRRFSPASTARVVTTSPRVSISRRSRPGPVTALQATRRSGRSSSVTNARPMAAASTARTPTRRSRSSID